MGPPLRSSALFTIDLASVLREPKPGFLEQMSAPQEAVKSVKKMGKIEQSKLILHSKCVATYAAPVFLPEPEKGLSQKKKKKKKQKSEAEAAVAKIRVEAARTLRKQKAQAARKQQEAEAVRRQEKAEAARKQQEALAARMKAKAGLSLCSTSCEASKVDVKSIQEVVVYVDGSRRGSLAGVGVAFVDVRLRHLNKSLRLSGNQHTSGTAEVAAAEQVVTIVGGNWKQFEGKTRSIVIRSDHSSLVEAMQSKNYTWKMGNLYRNLANKIAQLEPLNVSFEHVLKATRVKEHVEAHNFAGEATNPDPVCVSPPSIGKTKKKQQNTVPSKKKENKKKKEEKQKSSPSVTVTKKQKSQMVIPPVTVSKKQNVACVTVSKKQKTHSVILPVTVSKKQKKQLIVVEEKIIEQEQMKLPEPEILIQPCSLSSPTIQGGRILCEYRTAIRNSDWLAESYSQLHV